MYVNNIECSRIRDIVPVISLLLPLSPLLARSLSFFQSAKGRDSFAAIYVIINYADINYCVTYRTRVHVAVVHEGLTIFFF